jgi:Flp pilus assembly protein TadG
MQGTVPTLLACHQHRNGAHLTTIDKEGPEAVSNSKLGLYGRRTTRRRGQALVEFCLVVPIFLLLLSGVIDFGFLLFQRMSVINAAREGARAAAMVYDATTAETVAKQAAVSAAAQGAIGISASSVTVACIDKTGTGESCTVAKQGDSVRVTVSYTYHTFFPLLLGATIPLQSSVQMVFDSAT